MTDIVGFIAARLDEDEKLARATAGDLTYRVEDGLRWIYDAGRSAAAIIMDGRGEEVLHQEGLGYPLETQAEHIARHDPARVLRDVAAKLRIVGRHGAYEGRCVVCCTGDDEGWHVWPCGTIRDLASVWADHPDFDPAWAA